MALQRDALAKAHVDEIYEEHASGSHQRRLEFERAIRALRRGDTFVVWKLDRAGRNLRQLLEFVDWLRKSEVEFETITEGVATQTPIGKLILHVQGVFAEFERDQIVARTRAGLEAARARGAAVGGRRKLSDEDVIRERELLRTSSLTEVAARFRVSVATIDRYVRGRHPKQSAAKKLRRAAA